MTIVAILKHLSSKSANYGKALEYLIFQHDEHNGRPLRDENGNRMLREEYYLDGMNCDPFSFDKEYEMLNADYHKNQTRGEVKSHHYIISFDPKDVTECSDLHAHGRSQQQRQHPCSYRDQQPTQI